MKIASNPNLCYISDYDTTASSGIGNINYIA